MPTTRTEVTKRGDSAVRDVNVLASFRIDDHASSPYRSK